MDICVWCLLVELTFLSAKTQLQCLLTGIYPNPIMYVCQTQGPQAKYIPPRRFVVRKRLKCVLKQVYAVLHRALTINYISIHAFGLCYFNTLF